MIVWIREEKIVDRTKLMVKLIIFMLSFVVRDEFPNSNVWVMEVSVLSILFILTVLWKIDCNFMYTLLFIAALLEVGRKIHNFFLLVISFVVFLIYSF